MIDRERRHRHCSGDGPPDRPRRRTWTSRRRWSEARRSTSRSTCSSATWTAWSRSGRTGRFDDAARAAQPQGAGRRHEDVRQQLRHRRGRDDQAGHRDVLLPGHAAREAEGAGPGLLSRYGRSTTSSTRNVTRWWSSATSGEVFAAEFPTRSSASYLLVAVVGFVAFLAEGFLASTDRHVRIGRDHDAGDSPGGVRDSLIRGKEDVNMGIEVGLNCPACGGAIKVVEGREHRQLPVLRLDALRRGGRRRHHDLVQEQDHQGGRDDGLARLVEEGIQGPGPQEDRQGDRDAIRSTSRSGRTTTRVAGWICGYEERTPQRRQGHLHRERIPKEEHGAAAITDTRR